MRELTPEAVVRLACAALERIAFLMAEPGDGAALARLPAPTRYARIDYTGPENGHVVLAASEGFLGKLAAGLLGCDPAEIDPDIAGTDALRELANIVAGSLVCELGGERCPFSLGLPADCGHEALPRAPDALAIIDAEGERVEVHWERHALSEAA